MSKRWLAKAALFVGMAAGLAILLVTISPKLFYQHSRYFKVRPMINFPIPQDKIKKVVLDNGMTILLFKTPHIPKVLLQVAYDVGSAVEEQGEKGLAHLIEHMIFKGTEKLSEGDIDTIARKFGATFNAFTSKEVTSYYFEVNKNNWKPFIGILADCMKNARFDAQHLSSEMRAVLQELRMYRDNYWRLMMQKAYAQLYKASHPYHYPIIGFKQDLAQLNVEGLKKFYHKYYHPNKATFLVVGDIDEDAIVSEITTHFGSIPQGDIPEVVMPTAVEEIASCHTHMYQAVQKEKLGLFWQIPGRTQTSNALVSAASYVLAEQEGSRLSKLLVDQEKVASSVHAMSDQLLHGGVFMILVEPQEGKAEECKRLILEELEQVAAQGVDQDELGKMVVNQQRRFFSMLEQPTAFAYSWIQSFFATKDEKDLFKRVEQFNKLTSQDVQDFVARYLDSFSMNSIVVSPLPQTKQEVWKEIQKDQEAFERNLLAKNQRTVPLEEPKFANQLSDPTDLQFAFPRPSKTITLENGLEIILTKRDTWPLISLACQLRDSNYNQNARQGIKVDLVMDMLIEGSAGYSKDDNVSFFESCGAGYGFTRTGGFLSMLNQGYKEVFERFVHVLTQPSFDQAAFDKLKAIMIDQYKRQKDEPAMVARRELTNTIYGDHPFSWTFDDAIADLSSMTVSDLTELHKATLGPQNMILSVSGNFDLDQMEKDLRSVFGSWTGASYDKKSYPRTGYAQADKNISLLRDQVVLMMGRPSDVNAHHPDNIPLKLLNIISFASLGSRIYDLRERTGLFYAASGGWAMGASRENGYDFAYTILSPNTVKDAEIKIKELINDIGKRGVTEKELKAARQLYLKSLIDMVSNNKMVCMMMVGLVDLELGFDYYDKTLARIQSITVDELNAIAAKYFTDKEMSVIRVGRV